jgi:hypothetical protein
MSRTQAMFHWPGATLARIWPLPLPVSCTCPMRRMTCDCFASAVSAVLAPLGGGVTHAFQAVISSARSLSGVRPLTHARTASTTPAALLFSESPVAQPAHALMPEARVPREDWKPATASVVGPPVPVSFMRFEPALSSPNGLFGVHPW